MKLSAGDTVVFSARAIPGNEKAIGRVMNHIARRGADVISDADKHIHVSGHGSAEELKMLLALVRPQYFVPIHGEYRQLSRHARMARLVCPDATVMMIENGDVLRFDDTGARIADRVPAGRILIDGTRTGEIADEVLRDRRHLAGDGLVVAIVAINGQTGELEQTPAVITRGLAIDARHDAMLQGGAGPARPGHRERVARGAHGPRPPQRADSSRVAADVPQACRTASAGAPRGAGSVMVANGGGAPFA